MSHYYHCCWHLIRTSSTESTENIQHDNKHNWNDDLNDFNECKIAVAHPFPPHQRKFLVKAYFILYLYWHRCQSANVNYMSIQFDLLATNIWWHLCARYGKPLSNHILFMIYFTHLHVLNGIYMNETNVCHDIFRLIIKHNRYAFSK